MQQKEVMMADTTKIQNVNAEERKTLYTSERRIVNEKTGEIISSEDVTIGKPTKRENFIKIFVENLYFMATELSNSEKTILFFIIAHVNYKNLITISTELRKLIVSKSTLNRSTVYRAIDGLRSKNILLPLNEKLREEYDVIGNKTFLLNPNVMGKGTVRDLESLRQTVVTEFDFEKMEAKREVRREVTYKGAKELHNNPNIEISNIDFAYDDETNHRTIDIDVSEREKSESYENEHPNQAKFDFAKKEEDYDRKILLQQEQNKAKELSIKELELKIRAKELGLS